MKEITVRETSLDDAITKACVELGLTRDKIDYIVVEKGKKGLFGIGTKECTIKAWEKQENKKAKNYESDKESEQITDIDSEVLEQYINEAKKFVSDLLGYMGKQVELEVLPSKGDILVNITGVDVGSLIGKKGATLEAIEYLANLAINNSKEEYIRIRLDIDNYRQRRIETLENLAINMAKKAKRTGCNVSLSPMNAAERRIIHTTLQDNDSVKTKSEGVEPKRKVVIIPTN